MWSGQREMNKSQDFWLTVIRTAVGRCPNCGEGRLFASYLKPVERCSVCGEPLGHIRADDGPAWLTILLVGHILAPFLLAVAPNTDWRTGYPCSSGPGPHW